MRHAFPGEAPCSRKFPIVAILIFEAAALIVRSFWQVELRQSGYDANLARDISYLAVPPILAVLLIPVLRDHGKWLLRKYSPARLTWRVALIGVALGITLRLAFWGGLIAGGSFGLFKSDDPGVVIGPLLSWQCPPVWPSLLAVTVSVLMVPLIEEAVYRGFFLHAILARGCILAIVVSSMFFAIFHNSQTFLVAFVASIFFSCATLTSGGLWISTIAHATNNLVAFVDWRCFRVQWNPIDITSTVLGVGALALSLLVVSSALAAVLVSRQIIGAPRRPDDTGFT